MKRDDIQGEPMAPKAYVEFLLRVGGKTPLGEPMYRLVHTSTRFARQAGHWKEWAPELSIAERGGMVANDHGYMVASDKQPDRVVTEIREVLLYPHMKDRWVLERWMPAHMYGSREAWERVTLKGTELPILGPYPENGDYQFTAGPAEELPSFEYIQQAISECENLREQHRGTVEEEVLQRVADAEHEAELAAVTFQREVAEAVRDQLQPWTQTTAEAGRWRQSLAERAGVREHAGN